MCVSSAPWIAFDTIELHSYVQLLHDIAKEEVSFCLLYTTLVRHRVLFQEDYNSPGSTLRVCMYVTWDLEHKTRSASNTAILLYWHEEGWLCVYFVYGVACCQGITCCKDQDKVSMVGSSLSPVQWISRMGGRPCSKPALARCCFRKQHVHPHKFPDNRVICKVTLVFGPPCTLHPLFQWYLQSKEILLNLIRFQTNYGSCTGNSTENICSSSGGPWDKEKTVWNSVYHQNCWKN